MFRKNLLFTIMLCLMSSIFILSACSNNQPIDSEATTPVKKEPEIDPYEKLVKEKNEELELEPLELTSYSEDVGATISNPIYKKFAVNGQVVVEGSVEKYSDLKSEYAWIKVYTSEAGPAGNQHEYYTPIVDGKFTQDIHFFNGEGEYQIKVQLPSMDRENYYYDTASFEVINVNPEAKRDVTYTPYGQKLDLALNLESSYVKEDGVFSLKGSANLPNESTIMIKLNKEFDSWKHIIPMKDGQFAYELPLFYGEGLHELEVLVPDENRNNYYQTATKILIDNESNREMKPIEYHDTYIKRGVTLDYPIYGGEQADQTFRISGSIDPMAEFAAETTHLYVTTKLENDEALEVIPVENFTFDSTFHLRFGPGTYKVTVSVPEIKEKNSSYFRYFGFAQFEVESTATEDQRNLLPSRGIQSEAPEIIELAKELTKGKTNDRDKAKAIYDYVANTVSYDVEKFRNSDFNWDDSALKTLELKTGVCQDYAYLTIALLRAIDMEARFVEGFARGKHAWVEVEVEGEWLTMDPTWGAGYIKNNEFVAAFNEDYFDPKKSEFEKTHARTGVVY